LVSVNPTTPTVPVDVVPNDGVVDDTNLIVIGFADFTCVDDNGNDDVVDDDMEEDIEAKVLSWEDSVTCTDVGNRGFGGGIDKDDDDDPDNESIVVVEAEDEVDRDDLVSVRLADTLLSVLTIGAIGGLIAVGDDNDGDDGCSDDVTVCVEGKTGGNGDTK
jgi:hypothetical protein